VGRSRSNRPVSASRKQGANGESDVINGWRLLFHPLLLDQLERLAAAVDAERTKKRSGGTPATSNAKVLAALHQLIFQRIPGDPTALEFRQGNTLGPSRRHWFRAKFGAGRFRLFFRFRNDVRVIVFAWVNDESTLRTYGSRSDAYAVFASMLERGNPPDDWDALVTAARLPKTLSRTRTMTGSKGDHLERRD
jgi:toxin YhaV